MIHATGHTWFGQVQLAGGKHNLESVLPPYTRLGFAPDKRLLVLLVLNENLDAVRAILRDRLPLRR